MALMAICGPADPGVVRGIRYLLDTQLESGTWNEPWFTGTGFPRVFYLRYHLYRLYFPIMCLGRWLSAVGSK
jgi:squalene-hopene/tetraprenyl-beta-curcumene cyclase